MTERTPRRPAATDVRMTLAVPGGTMWEEDGQDLAEYAILIGLLALVVVGAVTLFGGQLVAFYSNIVATLPFS